jgi:hypothetical protein
MENVNVGIHREQLGPADSPIIGDTTDSVPKSSKEVGQNYQQKLEKLWEVGDRLKQYYQYFGDKYGQKLLSAVARLSSSGRDSVDILFDDIRGLVNLLREFEQLRLDY